MNGVRNEWKKIRVENKGLIILPASGGANSSMQLTVRGLNSLQDPAQAQLQAVLSMEEAIPHPMKMFLQQGRTYQVALRKMGALRLDTITIYTSWLEAELGVGQATGMIGDRDAAILNLQYFWCCFTKYLHLKFICYFIFLLWKSILSSLDLISLISKMKIIMIIVIVFIS